MAVEIPYRFKCGISTYFHARISKSVRFQLLNGSLCVKSGDIISWPKTFARIHQIGRGVIVLHPTEMVPLLCG